jgi:Uma2 family endonuclease
MIRCKSPSFYGMRNGVQAYFLDPDYPPGDNYCNFKSMREVKQQSAPLSVEEYIQLELQSERRHEYVNGQLIEMSGEKDVNNEIAGTIYAFLLHQTKSKGFQVYINDVKVAIPDKTKYFYPDVFLTREPKSEENRYVKSQPELIVKVISPSTHITDTVDKYIAYTSIPSLHYYLIVEPETVYVTLYSKGAEGKWEAISYVRKDDVIHLPLLELSLPLSEVYP